jgi:hypothetical protein
MLRSTAKDTIVSGKGVTSWLIRQSCPALAAVIHSSGTGAYNATKGSYRTKG